MDTVWQDITQPFESDFNCLSISNMMMKQYTPLVKELFKPSKFLESLIYVSIIKKINNNEIIDDKDFNFVVTKLKNNDYQYGGEV